MANSVHPDKTAPIGAVCSGSTLFASILNSLLMFRQLFAADDFSRRHFQMHFFLGALRVNHPKHMLCSGYCLTNFLYYEYHPTFIVQKCCYIQFKFVAVTFYQYFHCVVSGKCSELLNSSCLPGRPRQNSTDPDHLISVYPVPVCDSDKHFVNSIPENQHFIEKSV